MWGLEEDIKQVNLFVQFLTRRSTIISIVAALCAAIGTYYTVLLYKNLRTDMEELLPSTARSVVDLKEVTGRLESVDNLVVLIFCKDTQASKRFVDDLAAKLQKVPKEIISSIEYRVDKEMQFFKDRRALYLDTEDLKKMRDYVRSRMAYERALRNPVPIFSKEDIPRPKDFDFKALEEKYTKRATGFKTFPDGYYASSDALRRVIVVYMPGKLSGIEEAIRLQHSITQAVNELNPASYSPDLVVRYTGNVQNLIEEHTALIEDLTISTIIVVLLVMGAMLLFYKNVRATAALLISLFMGTLWTFGVAYFAVGYLNANSAFLASIVIGNGINFGIIFLARYLEERRQRVPNFEALKISLRQTAVPTATAALAAGLSYGSLILTDFRGFRQFGVIGLVGMVLCWGSAYVVLPALLTLMDRWKPLEPDTGSPLPKAHLTAWVADRVQRFPRAIWVSSFAMVLISLATFSKYDYEEVIETDLTKLRDKRSMTTGSGYLYHHIDDIFGRYLSPIIILPKTPEQADEIAAKLKLRAKSEGDSGVIAAVHTIDDFLPKDQDEKIKILRDIKHLMPPKQMANIKLPEKEQELANEVLSERVLKPITRADLPDAIQGKFREKTGMLGTLVLVDKKINHGPEDSTVLINMIHSLREVADSVAPATPVVGQLPVLSDMVEAVRRDGPRATLFALVAVVLLVIILFRNLRIIGLALFALGVGVLWLLGIILGFDIKINFLNFIALPITFGIGVDYGVNIFQRYKLEGRGTILKVIKNTGGAVGLCSLTTIIGYSSLLLAGNRALFSFGKLAVLGEITCVIAAIVSLPAFLITLDRKQPAKSSIEPRMATEAETRTQALDSSL